MRGTRLGLGWSFTGKASGGGNVVLTGTALPEDSATAAMHNWSPLDDAGIAWWYDISNTGSLQPTSGGIFRGASDLSGTIGMLAPVNSVAYSATAFNGHPGLVTDGSSSFCRTGTFSLSPPSTQYYALYISTPGGSYATGGTLSNRNALLVDGTVSGAWQFYAGNNSTDIHTAVVNQAYSPHLICVVDNGSSTTIYVDHWSTFDAAAQGDAGSSSLTELTIGGLDNSGAVLAAAATTMSETFAFSGAHTTAQRQAAMSFLGRKWGISVSA